MQTTLNIDKQFTFSSSTPDGEIDFSHSEFTERVGRGFNDHGVRKNTDEDGNLESVDVIFEAMEPGPPERRNGVRITEDFLDKVASKDYTPNPPHLKDHNDTDTFSRIGEVRDVWFSDRLGKLMLMTRTPNIDGSQNHQEAIARYTHEPPAIRDGSLGFGQNYEAVMNDDGEPEMRDGKFREFSTVNFPGGYDEGGVNTAFAEAASDFAEDSEDYTYEFSVGDWANRSYQGGTVHMKIRDRTKDCFTVDGNKICGEDGQPVYKGEEWSDGDFTGQMVAATQDSVSEWQGPQDMSETEAYLAMNFAEDDSDELDEVYSEWSDKVNMTASELERWADHPCSDEASRDPEAVRKRNLRLLERNKSDWTSDDVSDAKRTISFIERMRGQRPDSPAEGGTGTCPSEWSISLLNWAYNPFDGMPDGNPDPGENSIHTTTIEFEGDRSGEMTADMEELSEVYNRWTSMVNMTETQMEMWEQHPCSDKGVDAGEERRDEFMMLMGQPMESWDQESLQIANRAINFMATEVEKDPDNPEDGGPGTCPSRWAVNLLNRGHNPFDGFPSGNPQFTNEEIAMFDDPAEGSDKPGENPATKDEGFAVDVDTIQF